MADRCVYCEDMSETDPLIYLCKKVFPKTVTLLLLGYMVAICARKMILLYLQGCKFGTVLTLLVVAFQQASETFNNDLDS